MTPATLRARIAASDGSDQRTIISEAFDLFVPWIDHPSSQDWADISGRFTLMLAAQAHTDAALLIAEAALPGWKLDQLGQAEISMTGWNARFSKALEKLQVEAFAAGRQIVITAFEGNSPTLSLAIIDAVCAAKGG